MKHSIHDFGISGSIKATTLLMMFTGMLGLAQAPTFEVASVKPSKMREGGDGTISIDPGRFSARNATLKHLIFEAYRVPYSQITGGPDWIDSDEFDLEAKSAASGSPAELRVMLKALLADRFKLALHSVQRQSSVYVLTVGKGGAKLQSSEIVTADDKASMRLSFHCDLAEFADRLSTMLTIPVPTDPATPSMARGTPKPVLDRTGLLGTYDFALRLRPEPGDDPFTLLQAALQEQLGLKLEAQNAQVQVLIIDRAERVPTQN